MDAGFINEVINKCLSEHLCSFWVGGRSLLRLKPSEDVSWLCWEEELWMILQFQVTTRLQCSMFVSTRIQREKNSWSFLTCEEAADRNCFCAFKFKFVSIFAHFWSFFEDEGQGRGEVQVRWRWGYRWGRGGGTGEVELEVLVRWRYRRGGGVVQER